MLMLETLRERRPEGMRCVQNLASWYANYQIRYRDYMHGAGVIPSAVSFVGQENWRTANWELAFAAMGQLAAGAALGNEDRFLYSAEKMLNYLRTLQIFDPYNKPHYGAIREMTALTPWCLIHHSMVVAWSFIEYYRFTKNCEYLERAKYWGEWFLQNGYDAQNLPLYGVEFGEPLSNGTPEMLNQQLGTQQASCLNVLYELYLETKDERYIGEKFITLAEFFLANNQTEEGYFVTVDRQTKEPIADEKVSFNDNLATLGLLAAYRVTEDRKYLDAIVKYLNYCFAQQNADGTFENSVSGIPLLLNIMLESEGLLGPWPESWVDGAGESLTALFARVSKGDILPNQRGMIDDLGDQCIVSNVSAWSLIVLTKIFAGEERFLSASE